MGSAIHNRLLKSVNAFLTDHHARQEATRPCEYARLIMLSAPFRGLEMVLRPHHGQRNWTLGSTTGVDFYLRHPSLLDCHLNIEHLDDLWMITTHPDSGGCIVNGEPVGTAVLENGDRIAIGAFDFVFLEGCAPNPSR
ncbi:FHA domain-containing protein [Ketobacter sp.]|uniref:FHA domain-containing protein n=1 Tax=Ketobacter sp. TaxID=2083498 RepID=UPI000F14D304|nr:FHA domain-containing protein [Ketobacter sp.]RLU01290.1 MAG: FHA domain-containing protein [Ketobacter sp.]